MKTKITILIVFILSIVLQNTVRAQKIAAGGWHSVVVCSDKTVKAFGENATGQLGNGENTDSNVPVTAIGLTNVAAVCAGGDQLEAHSMALKSDGTVWAWGSNLYGQLGNASTTNTNTPVQTLLLNNVNAISAGGWHSVALKNDSTVWTWGWNMDGQLGDGSFNDRIVAAQVPSLTQVVGIAAGTYHVLVLKSDGTVWAWGDNISGQLGDGSNTDRNTPVQVSGLTNVVKIAAGRFFSLAVKSDGTIWTWGENLYGQLGNNSNTDSNVPVQVTGLTAALPSIVATGAFHCMVVKTDGTVWAWGRNSYGNLGDNTVNHSSVPVQMNGISDVAGMAAGTNFSILFKNDGTFWGCGRNASGQLGDGTFTQHNELTLSPDVCSISSGVETEFQNISFGSGFIALPNPSADGKYSLSRCKSNVHVIVYNQLGVEVFESTHFDTLSDIIDISNQPDGMYLLRLKIKEACFNVKLLKQ